MQRFNLNGSCGLSAVNVMEDKFLASSFNGSLKSFDVASQNYRFEQLTFRKSFLLHFSSRPHMQDASVVARTFYANNSAGLCE